MTVQPLLILFLLFTKHFLADFPLQTPYMLRKTAENGWVKPLLLHAGVHAILTCSVLCYFTGFQEAVLLSGLDFLAHLTIDAWKARLTNYPISDKRFWWAFGFNQWLHALTYLQIAYLVS